MARTPGVDIARVEVVPAYNPSLARNEPGNAPGAVTLMIIPKFSATRPDAPEPDALFLQAVCDYLDPRRLVTTELFLSGPEYQPIWVSVGINVVAGYNFSTADVREAVKQQIKDFLAPFSAGADPLPTDTTFIERRRKRTRPATGKGRRASPCSSRRTRCRGRMGAGRRADQSTAACHEYGKRGPAD